MHDINAFSSTLCMVMIMLRHIFLLEEKSTDGHSPGPGKTWLDVGNRKWGTLTLETWNADARERETDLLHRAGSGERGGEGDISGT